MGFWGSLWNGVKAVGSACVSVVKTVSTAVTKVVDTVVTPIVKTVTKAINYVAEPIKKAVDFVTAPIKKAISWVGQKVNRAKDWFLEETSIGRAIHRSYKWVMEDTFIGKGITWVKEKVSAAKQWFDNTSIGKCVNDLMPIVEIAGLAFGGVTGVIGQVFTTASNIAKIIDDPISLIPGVDKVKNFIENNTFVNKTIGSVKNVIGNKYDQIKTYANNVTQKAQNFIKNTKIGGYVINTAQKIKEYSQNGFEKTKDYLKNTEAGRFLFQKVQNIKNFAQSKLNSASDYLKNTRIGSSFIKGYQQGQKINLNNLVERGRNWINNGSKFLKENKQKAIQFGKNKILPNPYVQTGIGALEKFKNNSVRLGTKYAPHIYLKSNKLFKIGQNIFEKLKNETIKSYDKFKLTEKGKKVDKGINIFNKYIYKPSKWILQKTWRHVFKPTSTYSWQRIKNSKFYTDYMQKPIKSFQKIRIQAQHLGAKKVIQKSQFNKILSNENKQNGMDSSNFLSSFSNKYGGGQKSIEILKKKFVNVSDYSKSKLTSSNKQSDQNDPNNPEKQMIPTLNSLIDQGTVKIQQLSFDRGAGRNQSYTIKGNMKVENKTDKKINFEVLSGQMFGCSKTKEFQHTVSRGLKGILNPNETKQFILESFCGDVSLKWPYEEKNYTMTNFILRNFKDNQDHIWSQTS